MSRFVSIHASVKDATSLAGTGDSVGTGFNPRICKRCDSILLTLAYIVTSFNPRICKRCDIKTAFNNFLITVSIHASVKDATYETKFQTPVP